MNIIDISSTLFYGLVKDHAFHDGNKRTAVDCQVELTLWVSFKYKSINWRSI